MRSLPYPYNSHLGNPSFIFIEEQRAKILKSTVLGNMCVSSLLMYICAYKSYAHAYERMDTEKNETLMVEI